MKTKYVLIAFSVVLNIYGFINCQAQKDDSQNNAPILNYDVHREYNDDGDLIYFDSVAVMRWDSDTSDIEIDTLLDEWEYGDPNNPHPFYFGFRFPGYGFEFMPPFEFDFAIPDLHDLNEGFEYGFSLSPHDSLFSPLFPQDSLFYYHHVMPPFDMDYDIDAHIHQMEEYMKEFHERMLKEFYWSDPDFYPPCPNRDDSLSVPNQTPEPSYNNFKGNMINI